MVSLQNLAQDAGKGEEKEGPDTSRSKSRYLLFFFLVENIEMISLIGGKLYIQVYESY